MTKPTDQDILALANAAGVPVDKDTAGRISSSVEPALDSFAAIAGTLPFDLEPSTYVVVQNETAAR
jgi:hypothetical protein